MGLNKTNKLSSTVKSKMLVALSIVAVLLGITITARAAAASIPAIPNGLPTNTACGNANSSSISVLLKRPVQGRLYVRLPTYSRPSSINVLLYSHTLIGTSCPLLGKVTARTSGWIHIGQAKLGAYTSLVMLGKNLGAEPYAAAAKILVMPMPNACQATAGCTTTYQGYSGNLEPKLISGTSDQIAVYLATPINNLSPVSVSYYADGKFLYASEQLLPINRGYLTGGSHAVVIQANFANGEKFNINQNISEGTDWSGTLYLRSLYYRSHNKLIFFTFVLIAVLVLVVLLWLVRRIYRRHRYKINHGLTRRLK